MSNWFSNLFRRGSCADEHSMQLVLLHRSLYHSERRIMNALDTLNTKVDTLEAQLKAAQQQLADGNAKTDKLIDLTVDLKALVKQYQSSVPITDADVQAVIDKIDRIGSTVTDITTAETAETAKEDAALVVDPVPVDPAPVEPAPADPANPAS